MQVALLTRNGFRITDAPMPVLGPGDILVRSLANGVCGGDPHNYHNRAKLGGNSEMLGHEGTGVVEAIGTEVAHLSPGDIVTTLGGAFAEFYVAPASGALIVPDGIDPVYALGEPVACCVHGAGRFRVQPTDRIALIGCGFMGLVCLRLARLAGSAFALAIEPDKNRHSAARLFGADEVCAPQIGSEAILDQYGEFDLVLEAVGNQAALDMAGDLVAQHSRLAVIGYHKSQGGMRSVNMKQWNFKSIDVINAHVRRNDEKMVAMAKGLDLMATGKLDLHPIASPYPLSSVSQVFRDLDAHKPGLFKAVLVPSS